MKNFLLSVINLLLTKLKLILFSTLHCIAKLYLIICIHIYIKFNW